MTDNNISISRQSFIIFLTIFFLIGFSIAYITYSILFSKSMQISEGVFFENIDKEDYALLNEASSYIDNLFYSKDSIDNDSKIDGILNGYVSSLDDIHSEYLTPKSSESFYTMLEGGFEGIGTYVEKSEYGVLITGVIEGSPAQKADIKAGDIVVKADSIDLIGKPLLESISLIKGESGTKVDLEIVRKGETSPILITVIRDEIDIPSVYSEIQDNILYIDLRTFDDGSSNDIRKELDKFKENENLKGLILDLRMNGGGLLNEAVNILSLFIDKGEPVVITRNKDNTYEDIINSKGGYDFDYPIVVLIDEYSASASEITAGVLRDYNKATILGVKSYGKGSVQEVIPLSNSGILKLTVSHWFTPSETPIEGVGVEPDIVVEFEEEDYDNNYDRQLEEAKKIILSDVNPD